MLTIKAPAKINLTLEVIGKRPDGYHEIRSVMQTVSLCDTLTFQPAQSVTCTSDLPGWSPEKSLVMKTVRLLQGTTGTAKGALINVSKKIPLVSGLGGDSSDAAATLIGLNQLWKLRLPQAQLADLAAQLGSDVSFFLSGGTMLAQGRGELLTPLPPLPHSHFIIVVPDISPIPQKTKTLYENLTSSHFTSGEKTNRLVKALQRGNFQPSLLFNIFEEIAFSRFTGLQEYKDRMQQAGTRNIHLCGSGPALYALTQDKVQADTIYTVLTGAGIRAYTAETT